MSRRLLVNRTGMTEDELDAFVKPRLEAWDEYEKNPTDKNYRKFMKTLKNLNKETNNEC